LPNPNNELRYLSTTTYSSDVADGHFLLNSSDFDPGDSGGPFYTWDAARFAKSSALKSPWLISISTVLRKRSTRPTRAMRRAPSADRWGAGAVME
jgi:hypothetical protein